MKHSEEPTLLPPLRITRRDSAGADREAGAVARRGILGELGCVVQIQPVRGFMYRFRSHSYYLSFALKLARRVIGFRDLNL